MPVLQSYQSSYQKTDLPHENFTSVSHLSFSGGKIFFKSIFCNFLSFSGLLYVLGHFKQKFFFSIFLLTASKLAEFVIFDYHTLNENPEKLPRGWFSASFFFLKGATSCSCNLVWSEGRKSGKAKEQPPEDYTQLLKRFLSLTYSSNFCRNFFLLTCFTIKMQSM